MTGYRFNAQHAFVTYAQTKKLQSPTKLLRLVASRAGVENYLISQERHKDGGFHLHGYFKFEKKQDRDSENLFGWSYYGKLHMPHIQMPRKKHKLWEYIKKDKNFITNLDETRPKWLVALEDSTGHEEFLLTTMWELNRIDNYAGYRTYRDLWQIKLDTLRNKSRDGGLRLRLQLEKKEKIKNARSGFPVAGITDKEKENYRS